MKSKVASLLAEAVAAKQSALDDETLLSGIAATAELIGKVVAAGGTVYLCGNGGSACDAMHFSEELVARYKRERVGIKAMHFMDGATLTCWSNDYDYGTAFQRQAETFCSERDVLISFSTSGNSQNIIEAIKAARKSACATVLFTGKDGGAARELADISLVVPVQATERIQEVHITIVHILCELLETELL